MKQRIKTNMKMKKSILAALLVAFGFGLSAQTDTNARKKIEIQIEENTLEFKAPKDANMSSMIGFATTQVTRLQANHERILRRIDEQEQAGNLSEEEAEVLRDQANESFEASMERFEDLMENWGESYAERMEAWAEEYEAGMEAWSEEMERSMEADSAQMGKAPMIPPMPPLPPMPEAIQDSGKKKIIISKDGVIIGDQEIEIEREEEEEELDIDASELFERLGKRKSTSIKRTEDYFDIALGFNQQLEDGQYLIEGGAGELDFWKSTSFNMGIGYKTRIGSPYSKFYIKYGIDFSWHNFRLNGSDVLDVNADSSYFTSIGVSNVYEKNKYHIAYFNVPLMFQFDFSEAGDRDEAFTIGVGGYGGVRLMAKRELEYSTPVYRKVEEKAYDDFFTNQFRYGLMAQVGYKSFKVTASYDMNEFFRDNKGPGAYNMMNVTLGFSL